MKNTFSEYMFLVCGFMFGMFAIVIFMQCFPEGSKIYQKGYKQGQIDYSNNIIKYKLVKQNNSEMIWEEIKK